MDNSSGSAIQVVVSLREGKGFHRISNPSTIVASLNGQALETGRIQADSQPSYNTDLVWKADKNVLRKMRSGHEPVKLECFEIKDNGSRDKMGHILVSLRTARIILATEGCVDVAPNWHTLLNVRSDLKADKPAILLSLTIEESQAYQRRILSKESAERHRATRDVDIPTGIRKKLAMPRLVEEERLIQLGPTQTCRCLFLLEIIAGTAENLHLLREEESGERTAGDYSLWYRILDNDVRLKSFGSLEKSLALEEKAVIRIRSSVEMLRQYLWEKRNFLVIMQQRERILGYSEVDLGALLPTEISDDSLRNGTSIDNAMTRRCVLNKETTPRNIGDSRDNEAFLDLEFRLVYTGSKQPENTVARDIFQTASAEPDENDKFGATNIYGKAISDIDAHRNPCGDFSKCIVSGNLPKDSEINEIIDKDRALLLPRRSVHTAGNCCNKQSKSYRCYCLNVALTGIQSSLSMKNVEFRFHHPKAQTISRLYPGGVVMVGEGLATKEKLKLQSIGCKLNFISTAEEIRHLLLSFPPRVSVRDLASKVEMPPAGEAILDVDDLLARDEAESQFEAPLYDCDKNVIGSIDVSMHLEDHGPCYKSHDNGSVENLGPPIMDDSLAHKIVEELEIWKEAQQEIHLLELKGKEERHLDRLSQEWQKRRENLESKLACSVQQCKILANSLNMASEDLRSRRLKSLEKEARLIKANEDLQWRYEKKLEELQEAFQRMQQQLVAKINILQEEKTILEGQVVEPLRLEYDKLERLASKQAEELEARRKGALTQDQTASLIQDVKALEQKLENVQKSKSFFKEQWARAVREIHRMKMEHQQALEVQIKTSKDELKSLDLQEILCADSNCLTNDRITLGEIQKEMDVIKPRSSLLVRMDEPSQSVYKSEEQDDDRLRKLIEERDSLLKTGSYTIDDAIITKLNAEIRWLLASARVQ